jgi:hypothetical protein
MRQLLAFLLLTMPAWAAGPNTSDGYSDSRELTANPEMVSGNASLINFPVFAGFNTDRCEATVTGGKREHGSDLRFELSATATAPAVAWMLVSIFDDSADADLIAERVEKAWGLGGSNGQSATMRQCCLDEFKNRDASATSFLSVGVDDAGRAPLETLAPASQINGVIGDD